MTATDLDPTLQNLFATNADQELAGEAFTSGVMTRTDTLKRKVIVRRICVGLLLALLGIPLQDFALALTQVLVISLIELDNQLVAQLLAPVNSVGSLLLIVLFGLRVVHKRIFS